MADSVSKIRHDYRASKTSGTRSSAAIKWIVIHDAEVDDPVKGAEKVGSYFASAASKGSTHYGVDNDSTQQYLADNIVCWGAPGANTRGLHIELMGLASHPREKWIDHHGPMFRRAGWLVAKKAKAYDIPLRVLTASQVRAGKKGIVTHATITEALPGGSHTDPGKGFPMDVLMSWAKKYAAGGVVVRPVLHRGSKGLWVKRLQKKLGINVDGVFSALTEIRVKEFQRQHNLKADGIVGPRTWKVLGL